MGNYEILLVILVMAVVSFILNALPFYTLHSLKDHPFILYLSRMMPACVVFILVIFSYMALTFIEFPYGIPEVIAGFCVIGIHLKFKNMLLSMGSGIAIFYFLLMLSERI
jgi:branched-subunit amino acid transport protein AzlD